MNHYSHGAQVGWLFSTVLGIKPDFDKIDFNHFYLEPKPGGGLTFAKGAYHSLHGKIYSEWVQDPEKSSLVKYVFEIPPNSTATIKLRGVKIAQIEEKRSILQKIAGISDIRQDDDLLTFKAIPGKYSLDIKKNA
jgi:alpha-L-rhamnosidase